MAKLRHIAISLKRVGETDWAGAKYRMGEAKKDGGFYGVKFHDPDGIAFDITTNGWAGAKKV